TSMDGRVLRVPGLAGRLESRVVRLLFSGVESARRVEPPSRRRNLAQRAEAWLRQNLAEPLSIAALCAVLGATPPTLHQAFREPVDTTQKAYVKTLRLNAAGRDLLRGAASRVTDVALDWGFSHFGWFSQDYRRLFRETPSQTLRRGQEISEGEASGWYDPAARASWRPGVTRKSALLALRA